MGLWRSEDDPPGNALSAAASRDLLGELADYRESALLATPYLNFPGRLVGLEGQELRFSTSLTKDAAHRVLDGQSLRLRLPWKLSMVAGPVQFRGHRQQERRRELLLSRPAWLAPDEHRRFPRCELVGKSTFTITREDLQQVRGHIESVSAGGVGIYVPEPEAMSLLNHGLVAELGLRLDKGLELKVRARVVNGEHRRFGLAFTDALSGKEASRLQAWMKPRLEEAERRWEKRHAMAEPAELAAPAPQVPPPPAPARTAGPRGEGLLIIGSHLFIEEVGAAMMDVSPIRSGPPALAVLKPRLERPPLLAVMQVVSGDLEERFRLRTLWQTLALDCPLILLGTGTPGSAQELSLELRSSGSLQWDPSRPRFFQRMAQGLIQRGRGDEEEDRPDRRG